MKEGGLKCTVREYRNGKGVGKGFGDTDGVALVTESEGQRRIHRLET